MLVQRSFTDFGWEIDNVYRISVTVEHAHQPRMKSPPVTITAESKIAMATTAARDVTVENTQNRRPLLAEQSTFTQSINLYLHHRVMKPISLGL